MFFVLYFFFFFFFFFNDTATTEIYTTYDTLSLHDALPISFLPDIDPREHRFMIHGMVDRPLTFTMEDLKRLPSVTRPHFIECAGNRTSRRAKTVQETHGMTSCAESTGVLLSVLLKECGLKG